MEQRPSYVTVHFRELVRTFADAFDGSGELLNERNPEMVTFARVPLLGVRDVRFGSSPNDDGNHGFSRAVLKRSAFTSSHGRPASGFASRSTSRSARTS